jgi:hypothetical protein
MKTTTKNTHLSHRSRFFENLYQHHFIYEVARSLVSRSPSDFVSVLNAEVDDDGIDLILKTTTVTRYVQLKTISKRNSGGNYQIKETLSKLNGGCIVWICYSPSDSYTPFCYHFMGHHGNESFFDLSGYPEALKRGVDDTGVREPRVGYRNIRLKDANNRSLTMVQLADCLFPQQA